MERTEMQRPNRPGSPLGAILLIGLGLLFLARNFNLLDWDIVVGLWRLWPVVLILAGLQLVFSKSRFGSFLVAALAVITVFLALGVSYVGAPLPTWLRSGLEVGKEETRDYSVGADQFSGADMRTLDVDAGVGKVTIEEMRNDRLFDASFKFYGEGNEPTVEQLETDGGIAITVRNRQGWTWFRGTPESNLSLGRLDLPTDIRIYSGVGKVEADLSELDIRALDVNMGTGSADISLGGDSVPTADSRLEVGTGSIKLRLPREVGLKVIYDIGVGKLEVGNTDMRGTGTYSTDNYGSSSRTVDLTVKVGTGSIEIERD